MPSDTRQYIAAGPRVEAEVKLFGPQVDGFVGCQCKRCSTEFHRAQSKQQVMHDRVTHKSTIQHLIGSGIRLSANFGRQLLDGLAHCLGHLRFAARVQHDVGHPAHQILTKTDLRIHPAGRGQHLPTGQITQVGRDRCRAHIHGKAQCSLMEPGPDCDDFALTVDGHGHLPARCPQRILQGLQHVQITREPGQAPFELEFLLQSPQITDRIMHVGLDHLDIVQVNQRVDCQFVYLGPFAHHLAVHLTLGRHIDHHVPEYLGRAPEPAPGRQSADRVVLDLVLARA